MAGKSTAALTETREYDRSTQPDVFDITTPSRTRNYPDHFQLEGGGG